MLLPGFIPFYFVSFRVLRATCQIVFPLTPRSASADKNVRESHQKQLKQKEIELRNAMIIIVYEAINQKREFTFYFKTRLIMGILYTVERGSSH